MARPKLYLFVGAPGAGKTTIAHLIEEATGATHLWADHERHNMFNVVTHSAKESTTLYSQLNQRTTQLLTAGKSVIFDTNFNYRKDRDHLRAIAQKHGADTVVVWLQTPVEISRQRALHKDHRDRNRYQNTMNGATFDHLTTRLEPPDNNEHFITIDGSDIDIEAVKRQLDI